MDTIKQLGITTIGTATHLLEAILLEESGLVRREVLLADSERALTNVLHLFELLLEETAQARLEAAARDLGASEMQVFFRVTLPSLKIPIIAAFALCFTFSWDEFIVAFLLSGFDPTLPVVLVTGESVFDTADEDGVSTLDAAMRVAKRRLEEGRADRLIERLQR